MTVVELGAAARTHVASEEIRRVRRIRIRAAVIFMAIVVTIELVSNVTWSRYQGPPMWSRPATVATAADR